jgi:hypothetical protein
MVVGCEWLAQPARIKKLARKTVKPGRPKISILGNMSREYKKLRQAGKPRFAPEEMKSENVRRSQAGKEIKRY